MEIKRYFATLSSKKQITRDIFEFRFEKPIDFDFQAGQFVQFCIPQGEKTLVRAYSLSSTPKDPYLEFCIKFFEGGIASDYLRYLNSGDTLEFQGPRGLFIQKEENLALSFIATGTGIAPILSVIRDELENKKSTNEVRLLFGVRSEDDMFWVDRLQNLKVHYPNFVYDITLSQPKINGGWSGLRGRVTEHNLHHLVSHKFFLCGSAAMVKDVRDSLMKNGVEPKHIHFEIF